MIAGVVLAAGASRRFGSHKLLAPVGGRPLIRRTVESLVATSLDQVIVVLGRDPAAVGAALEGLDVRLVINADYAAGMSTSLRAGLAALSPEARAALVALGDQPGIGPEIVDALLARYRTSGAPIVAPIYRGGVRGTPVLFDRILFAELRSVTGDEGGRAVIARDPSRVALVGLDVDPPKDIDVPGDIGV